MLLRNKIEKSLSVHPFLKLTLPPLGRAGGGYQVLRAITILSFPY